MVKNYLYDLNESLCHLANLMFISFVKMTSKTAEKKGIDVISTFVMTYLTLVEPDCLRDYANSQCGGSTRIDRVDDIIMFTKLYLKEKYTINKHKLQNVP